ncbi:MAG: FxsA family protein [Parvularculaceae bacterium]
MTLVLIFLFIVGPIAEIFLIVKAGAAFGALWVIAACLATAAIGGVLLRLQGLSAINQARRDLAKGDAPIGPAIDGAFLVAAAPLLMTPGFLTDALGFAMLVPPVRRAVAARVLRWVRDRIRDGEIVVRRY